MAGTNASGGSAGSGTGGSGVGGGSGGSNSGGGGGTATGGGAGAGTDSGMGGSKPSEAGSDAAKTDAKDDGAVANNVCKLSGNPGNGKTCADYCTAFLATCAPLQAYTNTFVDNADCMMKCDLLTQEQLCCRALHAYNVNMTQTDIATHCSHAVGMAPCT
jgi:hypothetical protein